MADADGNEVPTREAFLEEMIAEALQPYRDIAPAFLLEEMEDFLWLVGDTHPVGSMLVDRARPRAIPKRSGEQPVDGASTSASTKRTGTTEGDA